VDDIIIPNVTAKSLQKKMAGVDAVEVDGVGSRLTITPRRAIPLENRARGNGGGGGGGRRQQSEKFRISENTFDSVEEARQWGRDNFTDGYNVSELRLNRETMCFQYRGNARAIRSNQETRQLNDLGWGISQSGSARIMPVLVDEAVKYIVVFKPEFLRN
jgi:hypothetical protein